MTTQVGPIVRERLLARLDAAPVALVVAPGGFGKSTLVRSCAAHTGRPVAIATVPDVGSEPVGIAGLVAAIADALADAVAVDAEMLASSGLSDAGGVLTDSLKRRSDLVLAVDDVHRLSPDAWVWIVEVGRSLTVDGAPVRLVLAARALPDGVDVPAEWTVIDAEQLRFDRAEVEALGGSRRGTDRLLERTEGWPIAVTMLLGAGSTGVARVGSGAGANALLSTLIDGALSHLPAPVAAAVPLLARVPLLAPELVDDALGPGSFERLLVSGLPLVARSDGWYALVDPVRELLGRGDADTGAAGLDVAAFARQAAAAYLGDGQLVAALSLLELAGARDAVIDGIAALPWAELDAMGLASARVMVDTVGPIAWERRVELLVKAAWVADLRDPGTRSAWLDLAAAITERASSTGTVHPWRATVLAELARSAANVADIDHAEALAHEALSLAEPGDVTARGRALLAVGHANTIRCTPASLAAAREQLEQAVVLFRLRRERQWEWQALLRLGYAVSFHSGRVADAAEQLGQVLALLGAPDRNRAMVLTYYADVLDHEGRVAEAISACDEALAIGRRLGDETVLWYAAWGHLLIASHSGDVAGTRRWIAAAEQHLGAWRGRPKGAEFGTAVIDALCCVGDLDGARERWPGVVAELQEHGLDDALAVVSARYDSVVGNPEEAERVLSGLAGRAFAVPRTDWVRWALRALAAVRRDDRAAAAQFVTEAKRELDVLGRPDLARRHEGVLIDRLGDLWDGVTTPPPAGRRLSMLGSFALVERGADVTPPAGHPATIVKVLALRGAMSSEQIIDLCWPEADATTGRARLRNTLNRLRSRSGEVVERRGDLLQLAADIEVDVHVFERLADAASAAPPHERAGAARLALAAFGGELLPGDRFEDWSVAARDRAARRCVLLADVLADDAIDRGDLDEAVAQLERAHDLDPVDETRLLRAAELLAAAGGRLLARRLVERASLLVDEFGLPVSDRLADLRTAVGLS
jgi:ATP/maltotriose-dependent transcriptional regulator MalT/DNA-binding SARP family transcriptional activator